MTIGVNKGHSGMQRHMPKNAIEAKVAVIGSLTTSGIPSQVIQGSEDLLLDFPGEI